MGRHSDKKQPPSPDWIRKLESSVSTHTDPIMRLAKHMWGDGDAVLWRMGLGDEPGMVHFSPPADWREGHPYSIPKGMFHTEGSADPFSHEVEGGQALVVWLKPEALPHYVPGTDARDLLRQRADQLATALGEKEGIHPLEVRVYFPPQKFIEATQGTSHEICAALILASTKENDAALRKAYKRLQSSRTVAEAMASREADEPRRAPSSNAIEQLLARHRNTSDDEHTARLDDDWLAVDEVASCLTSAPEIHGRQANGTVLLPHVDSHQKKRLAGVAGEHLGIGPEHTHVLLLPVDHALTARPYIPPKKGKKDGPDTAFDDGAEHDKHMLSAFLSVLHNECGGTYAGSFQVGTPIGDFIALSVRGDDQQAMLMKAKELIEEVKRDRQHEDRVWEQYLDDRQVEQRPPSHKR